MFDVVDLASSWTATFGGSEFTTVNALVLAVISVVGSLIFLPRPALCISAGFACGLWATPVVLLGLTAGAALGLLMSRHLASPWMTRLIGQQPALKATLEAIQKEGWWIIIPLRIVSGIPFSLLNYLYGLTRIHVGWFAVATMLGIAPSVLFYVYIGSIGLSALTSGKGLVPLSTLPIVGVFTLSLTLVLVMRRLYLTPRLDAEVEPVGPLKDPRGAHVTSST